MPPISVCIIAKNEEAHIGRCLKSLAPYGFEVILVDTGSADKTKEIALELGAKVFDFEWIDDFSAAKNYAASLASNNWILSIDCDEYVTQLKLPKILTLIRQYPRYIGLIEIENEMMGIGKRTYKTKLVRLYPRKYFQFEGAIHEQVMPIAKNRRDEIFSFDIPLLLYHTGYVGTPEQIAAKNKRNLDLLMAELKKDPDDPYIYFQIGQSCVLGDDYEGACDWFGKGLSFDVDETLEYVQTMVVSYGQSLLKVGRKEEALDFTGIYDAFSELADFVYLMGSIYKANGQPLKALGEFLKVMAMPPGRQLGVNTFLAFYQIAVIYDEMDNMEIALMYYQKCGDFKPALDRLGELEHETTIF